MTPWLDDGDVVLHHGDALEQLALMPSESVQCMVTSPPFFQLRDYNVTGQIGLEATLAEWISSLVAVFNEAKRVLRSDATAFIEVGDSYVDKQLAGAPWKLAFALQEAGWFLRSDIVWARLPPNPMPESVTDRPTKAHSYVFLLSKSARYFYDADAIRESHETNGTLRARGTEPSQSRAIGTPQQAGGYHESGRNARSVWSIPTEPTPFAHFATFPQALVERCIKAGTSEHGACSECGAPWRRITEREVTSQRKKPLLPNVTQNGDGRNGRDSESFGHTIASTTTGWAPSCGCSIKQSGGYAIPDPSVTVVPCVVLDPFMGSGTTALVARRLGRHAIGIELNAEYLHIAAQRLQQPTLWSQPV